VAGRIIIDKPYVCGPDTKNFEGLTLFFPVVLLTSASEAVAEDQTADPAMMTMVMKRRADSELDVIRMRRNAKDSTSTRD
jgi:hypothetical protein